MTNQAIVAKIDSIIEIPGADKIQVAKVLGESVVVSKDWGVGMIGVLFPVGVELSEDYTKNNNLNRNSDLNIDKTKKGFFEESRRVRCQPFLKVKSEGFFAQLDSLKYTGVDITTLKAGETFDTINGQIVCKKYISPESARKTGNANQAKQAKKNFAPYFEKHSDSEQFRHFARNIPEGALLSFHAKVHGTSARITNTIVQKEETRKWKKLWNKLTKKSNITENWEIVVGTRNVVLQTPEKEGFHGSEGFRFQVAKELEAYLEKGMTIYGEIAGYANGKPIMQVHSVKALKDKAYTKKYGETTTYKYGCKEHEYRFHIYRITRLTHNGDNIDMSQKEMEKWCNDRGILTTWEVSPQIVYDGDLEKLQSLVESLTERPEVLTEDYIDHSHISKGIIIRVDAAKKNPVFFKNKSYAFRVLEGLETAENVEDIS